MQIKEVCSTLFVSFILLKIDANKPIKNDVESQSVDVPSSTTIALSSDEPDDKNHSQSQNQSNDDKNSTGTGKLNLSMEKKWEREKKKLIVLFKKENASELLKSFSHFE